MRKLVIAAVLMLVASDNGRGDELKSAPTNPVPPAKIEPLGETVTIQQGPYRCVGQLCHPIPEQVSMNALEDWTFKFNFPSPYDHFSPHQRGWSLKLTPGFVNYFEAATRSPPLIQGFYVKMSGRASSPPDMDCRVFFQEVGDDLSGQGQYAYYRWRTKPLIPHAADWRGGDFVRIVGLEPEFWSSVTGEQGDASAAATVGFQQALANPQSIGVRCHIEPEYVGRDYDGYSGLVIDPTNPFGSGPAAWFTLDGLAVCDPFAPNAKQENEACALPNVRLFSPQ
jgi:hypothetical protein